MEIQIFNSPEFGEVRTITEDEKILFCATDVARALGYATPRDAISRHCKGVVKRDTPTSSGVQAMSYIYEGDLYRLVFSSKLSSAQKFEDWVVNEVLPAIRKYGAYGDPRKMSAADQIRLLAQGSIELAQKVDDINIDLQNFKETMPLLAVDCEKLTYAVRKKATTFLGGKESKAYKNANLRQKAYSDLHRELKHQFGVKTYKGIQRNQVDKALEFINGYKFPYVLENEVNEVNE